VKARTGRPFLGGGFFRGCSLDLKLIFKTAWDLPVASGVE